MQDVPYGNGEPQDRGPQGPNPWAQPVASGQPAPNQGWPPAPGSSGPDPTGQLGRDQTFVGPGPAPRPDDLGQSAGHGAGEAGPDSTAQWAVDPTGSWRAPTDHWGYQHGQEASSPGWEQPPAGWVAPQPGWGGASVPPPPPPGPPGGRRPASSSSRARARQAALIGGFLATAILFGGAGVGAGLALGGNGKGRHNAQGSTLPTAANSSPNSDVQMNVSAIAKRVETATVDITSAGPGGPQDEGTGMVLTSSGIVLTNNHVVAGSTKFTAQVNGAGRTYHATLLGVDPTDDVALLQLHGNNHFRTVILGNSEKTTVGQQVVAIGNALALTGPETVTSGIISAVGRSVSVNDPSTGLQEDLKGLFQTSAPINPGNSGGPLVNAAGQVIGMNTASASSASGGSSASNVGFAIPINKAMGIARQIQAGKASPTVFIGARAIMGVDVVSVTCAESGQDCPGGVDPFGGFFGYTPPVQHGAVVSGVQQGPAADAGIAQGDVIVSVNGDQVGTDTQLHNDLSHDRVGERVTVGWVDTQGTPHHAAMRLVAGPAL